MSTTSRDIQAIIFDCDGTLVDSEPISLRVFVELVTERGYEIEHHVAVRRWAGCDLHKVIAEVESQLDAPLQDDFLDIFRAEQLKRLASEVTPIDGAREVLQRVNKRRCVASNAPRNKVQLCLETTGLVGFFETSRLFSAYDVQAWKPRPDLFLYVAEVMGVAPEHCAVIEDSASGVQAGVAAGMQVIAFDPREELESPSDVHTIRHLSELIPIVS